ncbi:hypothetical protein M885DRAFT_217626 [Pelagophyceae sp. CCMP2097]|nr:hypothetical protein M885DRAFT_217626 [Pelagophyceae sp. CCMP2097]
MEPWDGAAAVARPGVDKGAEDEDRLLLRTAAAAAFDAGKKSRPKGSSRLTLAVVAALAAAFGAGAYVFLTTRHAANSTAYRSVDGTSYDVVVIGAGPAGAIVANKVATSLRDKAGAGAGKNSAAPRRTVLLLESGGGSQRVLGGDDWMFRDRTVFDVPLAWSYVARLRAYLWDVRGGYLARAVGGCGAHNAMLYVRALEDDAKRWNVSSWPWSVIEQRYLEVEDWQGDTSDFPQGWAPVQTDAVPAHHRVGGLIATSGACYRDLLSQKFLETVTSPAYHNAMPRTGDFNSPKGRSGAGYYHFNIRDGQRESVASVFLGGTISGYDVIPTLTFEADATVTRLVLEPTSGGHRVVAVEIAKGPNGDEFFTGRPTYDAATAGGDTASTKPDSILADKKVRDATTFHRLQLAPGARVVLAAGAYLTPHLLHVSGVGPRQRLEAAGLEVVVENSGVGVGLQDHPAVGVVFNVAPALTADMAGLYGRFLNWTHGQPFGSYSRAFGYPGFSAGAFFHSGIDEETAPDIQLTVFPIQIEPHLADAGADAGLPGARPREGANFRFDQAIITVAVVRPETTYDILPGAPAADSRARAPNLGLRRPEDGRTAASPLHRNDVARLVAGIRRVREVFSRSPLSDYVIAEEAPGAFLQDDETLSTWVEASHTPNSHWCCSAHFGAGGAVEPDTLKVHGVENLHVADASVFPSIPNGNVHSTVVSVAMEFAQRLIDDLDKARPP